MESGTWAWFSVTAESGDPSRSASVWPSWDWIARCAIVTSCENGKGAAIVL